MFQASAKEYSLYQYLENVPHEGISENVLGGNNALDHDFDEDISKCFPSIGIFYKDHGDDAAHSSGVLWSNWSFPRGISLSRQVLLATCFCLRDVSSFHCSLISPFVCYNWIFELYLVDCSRVFNAPEPPDKDNVPLTILAASNEKQKSALEVLKYALSFLQVLSPAVTFSSQSMIEQVLRNLHEISYPVDSFERILHLSISRRTFRCFLSFSSWDWPNDYQPYEVWSRSQIFGIVEGYWFYDLIACFSYWKFTTHSDF